MAEALSAAQHEALHIVAGPRRNGGMIDVALLTACGVRRNTLRSLVRRRAVKHRPATEGSGPKHWERFGITARGLRMLDAAIKEGKGNG